jgi:hypothetical protein
MSIRILKKSISPLSVGVLALVLSCGQREIQVQQYTPEILNSWNAMVMSYAIEEDGLLTLKGVRTEALMHVAIHNALNAVVGQYATYKSDLTNIHADPMAATAYAAYQVVLTQYPDKKEPIELELEKWLLKIPDGAFKSEGIELGKLAAEELINVREGDNWNAEADYAWHPMAPGVYAEFNEHSGTPDGFIFGAGWAIAEPFLLSSPHQFRSPPPPDIGSEAYTQAFNEVKELGHTNSSTRTTDQAHLAMWWKDFVENSHNRLARTLVEREQLNLWQAARVFALLNMTIYDAYVSVFDNKFHYNHWRPYTAIRWADNDDNPDTEQDLEWNNLHEHTYAFPSYPSAHGTASTAAMTVLAHTLGTGDNYAFTMVTEEVDRAGPFSGKITMNPPTRSFSSFSEAGMEASMSRVYLGIHFRYDSEEGFKLGRKIGEYANENFLVTQQVK